MEWATLILAIAALIVGAAALPDSPARKPLFALCAVCVIAALGLAIGSGLIKLPSGSSVRLSASAEGPRSAMVTAELDDSPTEGRFYWFILQVHDVSGDHSEWYPRRPVSDSGSFSIDIPTDADATRRRTGAIYEVTASVDQAYRSGRPDPNSSEDFVLVEPCCAISDEIELPF